MAEIGCFESVKKEFISPTLTLPTRYKDNDIAYYFFKKQQSLRGTCKVPRFLKHTYF